MKTTALPDRGAFDTRPARVQKMPAWECQQGLFARLQSLPSLLHLLHLLHQLPNVNTMKIVRYKQWPRVHHSADHGSGLLKLLPNCSEVLHSCRELVQVNSAPVVESTADHSAATSRDSSGDGRHSGKMIPSAVRPRRFVGRRLMTSEFEPGSVGEVGPISNSVTELIRDSRPRCNIEKTMHGREVPKIFEPNCPLQPSGFSVYINRSNNSRHSRRYLLPFILILSVFSIPRISYHVWLIFETHQLVTTTWLSNIKPLLYSRPSVFHDQR